MDSAASRTVSSSEEEISDLETCDIVRFSLADKGNPQANTYSSDSKGWVRKSTSSSSTPFSYRCHYVPGLGKNLISVGELDRLGYVVVFGAGKCRVFKDRKLMAVGDLVPNNLYRMDFGMDINIVDNVPDNTTEMWHNRLIHAAGSRIERAVRKGLIKGINPKQLSQPLSLCPGCLAGKHRKHNVPKKASKRMPKFGMRWFMDISVVNVRSLGGKIYYAICVDDHSRWVKVYALSKKTEVLEAVENLRSWSRTQTGREPQIIRTDNEGVFLSDAWREALEEAGLQQEAYLQWKEC
jgi:hypothetical protein